MEGGKLAIIRWDDKSLSNSSEYGRMERIMRDAARKYFSDHYMAAFPGYLHSTE